MKTLILKNAQQEAYASNVNFIAAIDTLKTEDEIVINLNQTTSIKFRPIQPEDQRLIQSFFNSLSRETIYYRYFGYIPTIDAEFLARFTCIHPKREITIVAETRAGGVRQIIGVAQVVKDPGEAAAEFGILIADAWQKQGIGYLLAHFTQKAAVKQGVRKIYAHFMAINKGIAGLLRKQGYKVYPDHFDAYYAELDLTDYAPD